MNFVMTAAPLAMRLWGHAQEDANLGLQWHVIAMYGPSFFTGRLITRFGADRVMTVGLTLIGVSAIIGLAGVDVAHSGCRSSCSAWAGISASWVPRRSCWNAIVPRSARAYSRSMTSSCSGWSPWVHSRPAAADELWLGHSFVVSFAPLVFGGRHSRF